MIGFQLVCQFKQSREIFIETNTRKWKTRKKTVIHYMSISTLFAKRKHLICWNTLHQYAAISSAGNFLRTHFAEGHFTSWTKIFRAHSNFYTKYIIFRKIFVPSEFVQPFFTDRNKTPTYLVERLQISLSKTKVQVIVCILTFLP